VGVCVVLVMCVLWLWCDEVWFGGVGFGVVVWLFVGGLVGCYGVGCVCGWGVGGCVGCGGGGWGGGGGVGAGLFGGEASSLPPPQ